MDKEENKKQIDVENDLADEWNEKLKLDKNGNLALMLVCIFEFALFILFSYLFSYLLDNKFNLLYTLILALIITSVTGYYAYKRRNKD